MEKNYYISAQAENPHLKRMREILTAHPEVKTLFGNTPSTALYATFLVMTQIGCAFLFRSSSIWVILIVSYLIGAILNHALFVIIHECTHNLVFKKPNLNRFLGIFSNFPQFFPSAMAFFKYHMLHHQYQGEYEFDPDIAKVQEAKFIGNSSLRKLFFLTFFGLIQGLIRPMGIRKTKFLDRWIVINFVFQFAFLILIFYWMGGNSLLYFLFSTIFALGLHPLGARWIQEHYVIEARQETYSYYGPLNKLCFNMGYHNEHHDFMKIPWSRLPQVKSIAPEFYNPLYYYKSWTRLLFRFIFDPKITLFNRMIRSKEEFVS